MADSVIGVLEGRPGPEAAKPPAAETSLESYENTVTPEPVETARWFEAGRCRCDCWFCPDCCRIKAWSVRAELIPILETFTDLRMVTFTVDPTLFHSPGEAYLYLANRRCVSRTIQDLRRAGALHSGRYFYVVEWQKNTEQAHFHVLLDAGFIPHDLLLAAWSKHRPADAGDVEGERPPFGTVFISKSGFEGGAVHAARYATKYLMKVPSHGFPGWVLEMGKARRVRRYSTSRGFWGREAEARSEGDGTRKVKCRTYAERLAGCGSSVNVFEMREWLDLETGELTEDRRWVAELAVSASVLEQVQDVECPERPRAVPGDDISEVVGALEAAAGHPVERIRSAGGRSDG